MISQMSHVMTLANSIIGVSVLAMPFCFKQCGIVLATLVLILSSILSRLACYFLIKSAVMSRRRNFELLAFHAFGHMGKFLVELFIIGFLVGTCIAFFVVMGDLGPQIVGKVIDKNPADVRTTLLITTSIFIVLPLGLLRNIDSLSSLCTATIIFYLCLVLKIVIESMHHIFAGDWYEHVYYWKPSGMLQCIPIFSMALFCQTQLFEIYETIPNVSLEKMNDVVRGALNICTVVYLCVGFFGYIAFCTQPFTGNILMSFEPSLSSEMIKMGFVFSIAFSFPLVIFPCRASLNSLLFRRVYAHEPSMNYLPEARFRYLTIIIVAVSLITGIIIPNIEFVLGLVGSTIGIMICLIFPTIFFISISSKHTNERLLAQVILFIGICIMILSTYANLYALEESTNTKVFMPTNKPHNQISSLPLHLEKDDINSVVNVLNKADVLPNIKDRSAQVVDINVFDKSLNLKMNDVRQEPPIPVERIIITEKPLVETHTSVDNALATSHPVIKRLQEERRTMDESLHKESKNLVENVVTHMISFTSGKREENTAVNVKESFRDAQRNDNLINSDAIKKEESELAAAAEADNILAVERHEKLRQTLEKHKQEQLEMMKEQKEILTDLKEQRQEIERQKQRMIEDTRHFEKNDGQLRLHNEKSVLQIKKNITKPSKTNELDLSVKQKIVSNVRDSDFVPLNNRNLNENQNIEPNRTFYSIDDANNKTLSADRRTSGRITDIEPETRNSKQLPKGPILNALTKRVSQKSNSVNVFESNNNERNKIVHQDDTTSNSKIKLSSKAEILQHEYSVPIALKILNHVHTENMAVDMENKTDGNVQVIRRDILEDHERKRRDTNVQTEEIDAKVANNNNKNDSNDHVIKNVAVEGEPRNEKCLRQNQDMEGEVGIKLEEKFSYYPSKSNVVHESLIKTNAYLSDHGFTNAVTMDSSIPVRDYLQLKQRDLKSMDTREGYNI